MQGAWEGRKEARLKLATTDVDVVVTDHYELLPLQLFLLLLQMLLKLETEGK